MSAKQPLSPRASLRGWFGMIAYAACWCGVFRAFPVIAMQFADLVWHEWLTWPAWQLRHLSWTWFSLSGQSLFLVAYWQLIVRPKSSAGLIWFTLAWAITATAFAHDQFGGRHYMFGCSFDPRDTAFWVLFPVLNTLLPTLVLTLPALAIGVIPVRWRTSYDRWLTAGWLIVQLNLMLLVTLELGVVEYAFPRDNRQRGSLCHPNGTFFTPMPPPEEEIIY